MRLEVGSIHNGGFAAGAVMNSQAAPQAPNSINGQSSESAPLSEAELTALQALASGGLSAEALQGSSQALADTLQGAITNGCNKLDCEKHPHDQQEELEPWERRQEEREHLEALRDELDRQDEAAQEAEAMLHSGYTEEEARRSYDETAAADRLSAMVREGDPQTREDIEKRLAELDAEDAKEDNLRAAGYDEDTIKRVTGERKSLSSEEYEQINRFIDDRPKIKQEILSKIPDGGLKIDLSKQGLSETIYTKKAAREMLSDKAIDASVRNGCPVSAHVEAVRKTPEIVSKSELKGNTAPTKKKDKIDKISHLEAPFQASDKKNYIAHYTVHHPKPNPQQPNKPAGSPRLYFLFIRKGKPE